MAQHRLKLLCTYEDGTTDSIDVPESHYIHAGNDNNEAAINKKIVLKQMFVLVKRALMLLKGGNVSLLYNKIKRYKRHEPTTGLNVASDISKILNPKEREKVIFFLDHDLGGGR